MSDGKGGRGERAQLATSLVEAVVGILFVVAVAAGFALVPVGADGDADAARHLDRTASDALSVLSAEPPTGSGVSRLTAACRSDAAFENEREALATRLDAVLSEPVSFRLVTPHGHAGSPRPGGLPTGHAERRSAGCTVTLWVWYV